MRAEALKAKGSGSQDDEAEANSRCKRVSEWTTMSIVVDAHGCEPSPPEAILRSPQAKEPNPPRALLQSIRNALKGNTQQPQSSVFFNDRRDPPGDEELSWNASTVILSAGSVIRRKWSFHDEGQPVQYACFGSLEDNWRVLLSTSFIPTLNSTDEPENRTFGPFSRQKSSKTAFEKKYLSMAVFIFLRSIGKVYLRNGIEYTFSLPFIVRKAWPLTPHGVLLQRVLEPYEEAEAAMTGDTPLPTIFSFISPYAEATTVGMTSSILGGFARAPRLANDKEDASSPLQALPHSEIVVFTSYRSPANRTFDICITVDPRKRTLSVWRYAYIKPKEASTGRVRPVIPESNSAPALSTTTTMASLISAASQDSNGEKDNILGQASQPKGKRRNSLTRTGNDLTRTLDKMVIGSSSGLAVTAGDGSNPQDHGRMSATYWMERVYSQEFTDAEAQSHSSIHAALFDDRWDGKESRGLVAICIPASQKVLILKLIPSPRPNLIVPTVTGDGQRLTAESEILRVEPVKVVQGLSVAAVQATRHSVHDLLILRPGGQLFTLLTHGVKELSISPRFLVQLNETSILGPVESVTNETSFNSIILRHRTGKLSRMALDFIANDIIISGSFQVLQRIISGDTMFALHTTFLLEWIREGRRDEDEFVAFKRSLEKVFGLNFDQTNPGTSGTSEWERLGGSRSHRELRMDRALSKLKLPPSLSLIEPSPPAKPHPELGCLLLGFHLVAEELRLQPTVNISLLQRIVPIIIHLAQIVDRIEWADFWARMLPGICDVWPRPKTNGNVFTDDRIPMSPPDFAATLQGKFRDSADTFIPGAGPNATLGAVSATPTPLATPAPPDHNPSPSSNTANVTSIPPAMNIRTNPNSTTYSFWPDMVDSTFASTASLEYGKINPLVSFATLLPIYNHLAGVPATPGNTGSGSAATQKRAEMAVISFFTATLPRPNSFYLKEPEQFINRLSLGLAAPIREALRSCQVAPPSDWSVGLYRLIGRNDLAATAREMGDVVVGEGYKGIKHFLNAGLPPTIGSLVSSAISAGWDSHAVSGVEFDPEDDLIPFRFGQDRRLEDVARMLNSSAIESIRIPERAEMNESDQAKEHQLQVMRIAERTLALPFGRAMFTFSSMSSVTRELYTVPKLEFTIRLQPHGITIPPEPGKISPESISWGEFHNGVAAALRISSKSTGIESSWIAFNRPGDMTAEHAGFLYGLGLTGHLREMMTWHTFGYLTLKHDLTSIGILLGLAVANVGTGDEHVTKLLAVHTPALLPTPGVDLNVSLMTQAAGLSGIGLLYLGTKNRRMAEVCLGQIRRPDLVQPDITNEHREAYTFSAALAFGMIMLGKGSEIPADGRLVDRLSTLVHGEANLGETSRPSFDVNLTSPAATIAVGLMYLRTERQDIADVLAIPDTILALHRVQPGFLMVRTIARSLILWNQIAPTNEWLFNQIPKGIRDAIEQRAKTKAPIDEAIELAYYNILAGGCFAIGLKYAGTSRETAYMVIVRQFDIFTRLGYQPLGAGFDVKIRRSTLRDGLNIISLALSMVMVGSGELSCHRRIRHAYGAYNNSPFTQPWKYGIHISTHMSLGLLFLGGGKFVLGTSDAAIAAMVTAFFPRFHHMSYDNKSYLQALRHLWVLAVEPRCLVARDVDTSDVVFLPIKLATREGSQFSLTKLVTPTLFAELDHLAHIRIDTPRYWPFYLDIANFPRHRQSLLRNQTLFVKRRSAFLSYSEDRKGSRCLFVRSGSSAGDVATLNFPQVRETTTRTTGDLADFIASTSNDIHFLAFADHFTCDDGETNEEKLFSTYCHAVLLDTILHDKRSTIQSHMSLFLCRRMDPNSPTFHMRLQDLWFAVYFYGNIYGRRFSGRTGESAPMRMPLIRDSTVLSTLHALDVKLNAARTMKPSLPSAIIQYARGDILTAADGNIEATRDLAWYLVRHSVPTSSVLSILKDLAHEAYNQCLDKPPPDGTDDTTILNTGIKEVLHLAGNKMSSSMGSGWSVQSLDDIINAWQEPQTI